MKARIYHSSKTAMQSGRAKAGRWVLEYESSTFKRPEPLMGWTQSGDTHGQVSMVFETLESAESYAQTHKIPYTVQSPQSRRIKPRNYGDNFKYRNAEE